MRIVDLSSPVDAEGHEPDPIEHVVLDSRAGALHMAREMYEHFGIEFSPDTLPDGEFLTLDRVTLTSHTGTHVDAPAHYGSTTSYGNGVPRTIDQIPLEWFHGPAVVLDLTDQIIGAVGAEVLEKEFARIGHVPTEGDIVLLRTGADAQAGTPAYFTDFTGLDGPATALLLDHGVRVIGTDAFSLDAPFTEIIARWRESGDPSVLWPAHMLGRSREYCQIERLAGLHALPALGATLQCFPVKLARGGAGWARAVAFLPDGDDDVLAAGRRR